MGDVVAYDNTGHYEPGTGKWIDDPPFWDAASNPAGGGAGTPATNPTGPVAPGGPGGPVASGGPLSAPPMGGWAGSGQTGPQNKPWGTGANNNSGWDPGAFVPPQYSGRFFDNQDMAATLGSYGMGAVPGAAEWQAQLFNPGFNPGENAFMQSMGDQTGRLMQKGFNNLSSEFAGMPGHSSYLNMASDLMENSGRNLGNIGLQAWQQRQGLAGQALNGVMTRPLQASQQGQQSASDQAGLTSGLMNSYFQMPMGVANQSPIMAPAFVSGGGGGTGKKG